MELLQDWLKEIQQFLQRRKSQTFTTASDNQTSVDIHVLQGERQMAGDNVTLGRFQLDGIAPARRRIHSNWSNIWYRRKWNCKCFNKDLGTGKEQHITITSSTNLSDEEIERK